MAQGHRWVGVALRHQCLYLTPSSALPLLGGGRNRATITASRTRTGIAIGCSAKASIRRAGQASPAGSCTGSSGDGIVMARYAELDVTTNFSFLRGGSHPEELVAT